MSNQHVIVVCQDGSKLFASDGFSADPCPNGQAMKAITMTILSEENLPSYQAFDPSIAAEFFALAFFTTLSLWLTSMFIGFVIRTLKLL